MAEESNARDLGVQREGRAPTIYVTDAAAESARIADTLRAVGYDVVDVPLSMLVTRAQAQRPDIVLVDIDADGALATVAELRQQPGGGAVDFFFFSQGEGPIRNADDALAQDGSAYFRRPVDVSGLVRRIEAVTGGPVGRPELRVSTPPPSIPIKRQASAPPERPSTPSLPAPGARSPGPPLPLSNPSLADLVDAPRSFASFGTVSSELQQLLAEAEHRAEVSANVDAPLPSPEEEIETVLPADVLASLDEPISDNEDEDNELRHYTGSGTEGGTGAHAKGTTASGSKVTSSGRSSTHERRLASDQPPRRSSEGPKSKEEPKLKPPPSTTRDLKRPSWPSEITEPPRSRELAKPDSVAISTKEVVVSEPPRAVPPSEAPKPREPASVSAVITRPADARRFFAQAITRRASGVLCFEHEGIVRRVVLRDGDLVTAASGAERESLVCFLGARGDLPRDEVERLAGKVPPYGRHAGAALVAHGWLRQDQLWSVLRGHAEWIASSVFHLRGGTAQLETEAPGRLRSEPSVFGASTGPEVFVELVRRAVPPDDAVEAMGGDQSRVAEGPSPNVLRECSLSTAEIDLVTRGRGGTVGELLSRAGDVEMASLVHALALLGVLEVVPAPDISKPLPSSADLEAAALDDEAVRARVRAKLELVEEGDYFAVLGVARDATSYEVRRAFLELRRAFEPSRILNPRLADLSGEVRKIVTVIEEAYEILRDVGRRERYRRAIDARP